MIVNQRFATKFWPGEDLSANVFDSSMERRRSVADGRGRRVQHRSK